MLDARVLARRIGLDTGRGTMSKAKRCGERALSPTVEWKTSDNRRAPPPLRRKRGVAVDSATPVARTQITRSEPAFAGAPPSAPSARLGSAGDPGLTLPPHHRELRAASRSRRTGEGIVAGAGGADGIVGY